MKKMNFLNLTLGLALLLPLAFFQMGCPSKSSPSSPNNGNSGPTATPTATPVLSFVGLYVARTYANPTYSYYTRADLQLGGQPVSTAAVTLTSLGAGVTLAIPYSNAATAGGVTYSMYNTSTAFTYTPGQNYVISAAAGGQTASATLTAPGGGITPHLDSNGAVTQFTVSTSGNTNTVLTQCTAPLTYTYSNTSGPGTSVNIPDSGVSNAYAAPGTLYTVYFSTENLDSSYPEQSVIADIVNYAATVLDNVWYNPSVSYSHDPVAGDAYLYQVGLNIQGTAPTTAAVTVTEASNTLALPYSNTVASGGVSYAIYTSNSSAIAYAAGFNYVLSATGAAGTSSVTLYAPGSVFTLQDSTTGAVTQIHWPVAGTYSNAVSMNETSPSSVTDSISSATSPEVFPLGTFYSTAVSGNIYQAWVQLISTSTSIANGVLAAGSPPEIGETYTQTVTFN